MATAATAPAGATPKLKSKRPATQKEKVLAHAVLGLSTQPSASSPAQQIRSNSAWPSAGSADVKVTAPTRATDVKRAQRAGALPITLTPTASGAGASSAVHVQIHDRAAATRAHVNGVLFSVTRTAAADAGLSVSLDYSSFRNAGGAEFSDRLHLVTLPACALTTPSIAACQVQTPVLSTNNATAATISATVTTAPGPVAATRKTPAGMARTAAALPSASGARMVMAAVAGAAGSNGTFKASSLSPSGSWSVSGSSGSFQWSYPIATPAAATGADVAPSVALSYNSGSVDGRIASTNNQPSWVGEGWDYNPGYIERTYRSCADDTTLPALSVYGDLCWAGQILTMNLGGQSTALVLDDASDQWHAQNDNGQRVELVNAGSGAYQNEYWRVTTTDGIQYYFGRDTLPGGTTSTNATWTEPVYGAHGVDATHTSADPCHAATFAASKCTQAWRWNLDYVIDPHHNASAYYYTAETNFYGAANTTTPTSYVRGGYLSRIEYGLQEVAVTGGRSSYTTPAPRTVIFGVAERCTPSGAVTCLPTQFSAANATNWPDTPADQLCSATPPCANHSPTFWSTKKLTSITTNYFTGSGTGVNAVYKKVDSYALGQSFPSTGDPELELDSIVRTGYSSDNTTSTTLPTVSFTSQLLDNRVHGYNAQPTMAHWRLSAIHTETGEIIAVTYNQAGRAAPACTATTVPANPAQNTTACFPVWWTPPSNTAPVLDYFHKYMATEVDVQDPNAIAPNRITTYTYVGTPAWHYDDNEVTKPANRTWGQFRGYQQVQVRTGNPNAASNGTPDQWTLTTTTFFRGMNGDRKADGTATSGVTVPDSHGGTVADENLYPDTPREVRTFNGDTAAEVSSTLTTPVTVATTATRSRTATGLAALTANIVNTATTVDYTDLATGGQRYTRSDFTYNAATGLVVAQSDTGAAVAALCTTTAYAIDATTPVSANSWIRNRVSEKITSAQTCPTTGPQSPVLSDTRTYYDASTTLGAIPSGGMGDGTQTRTATDHAAPATTWAKATATYDAAGRPLTSTTFVSPTDTTGRTAQNSYTATGGQLTKTITTNPLGQTVTTTLDPARGVPLESIDIAGHKTDAAYDALGRLTSMWLPGQVQGTNPASTTYSYLLRTTGPLAVTTKTLIDPGNNATPGYRTSISLYDAFGSLRQTQTDAVGGGRIITDTYNDSHGIAVKTSNHWYTTGTPATDIITTADSAIDDRTILTLDGAGRTTVSTEYQGSTPTWNTRTIYGGDRTTVIPPAGGVQTTSITDANGKTIELDQWTTPPTVAGNVVSGGTAQKTTYHFTALGQQDQMTTAAGTPLAATWTTSYDLSDRAYRSVDPDSGTTTTTFDDTGAVTATTDANNQTLSYTYDSLGRKTGEYAGTGPGTQLSGWVYDTLQKGQLTSSTRYTATGNYTVAATGYDAAGNPTGTTTTLPTSEAWFASAYTTSYTWTSTHLMATQTPADGGSLPSETIQYFYDNFGDATGTAGLNVYVSASSYSPYGEPNQYSLGVNQQIGWLTYSRDLQTRRVTTSNLSVQAAVPQLDNTAYTYDPSGNITRSVDTEGGGTGAPTESQCYSYDTLDQLTQAWSATDNCATDPTAANSNATVGGAQPFWTSWTIDAAGGRTKQIQHATPSTAGGDTTTTYTNGVSTPAIAHALQSTSTNGPAGTSSTYNYNPDGSTLNRTVAGSTQTFTYTPDHHINTIASPAGTVSYIFDADGTQLVRHDPATTTVYLPGEELTRTTATGIIKGTRFYTHNGTVVSERTVRGYNTYLYSDPHNTNQVSVATTDTGTATPIRRYLDPYGNALGTVTGGTWPDQHGFLNKPTDTTTALTDIGARQYDPTLGRFTTVDPVLDPGSPQQDNGYSYAWNNPITKSDPAGLSPCNDDGTDTGCGGNNNLYPDRCNADCQVQNEGATPAAPGNTLNQGRTGCSGPDDRGTCGDTSRLLYQFTPVAPAKSAKKAVAVGVGGSGTKGANASVSIGLSNQCRKVNKDPKACQGGVDLLSDLQISRTICVVACLTATYQDGQITVSAGGIGFGGWGTVVGGASARPKQQGVYSGQICVSFDFGACFSIGGRGSDVPYGSAYYSGGVTAGEGAFVGGSRTVGTISTSGGSFLGWSWNW